MLNQERKSLSTEGPNVLETFVLSLVPWVAVKPTFWSQIRQDYPLNLSISVSGGKETNKDSPSSGE